MADIEIEQKRIRAQLKTIEGSPQKSPSPAREEQRGSSPPADDAAVASVDVDINVVMKVDRP